MTRIRGRNTFDSANSIYTIERILAALKTPKTYAQLMAELFITQRSLCRYLSHLRANPNRRVFVKKYLLINHRHSPVFALGSKPDAIMPKQSSKERNALRQAKVKADPDLSERRYKYEAARWLTRKPKAAQSWLSALGA